MFTAFSGKAKVWFEGTFDNEVPIWGEFVKVFNEDYKPVGYNEDKLCEFYSTKRSDDEDPIEYLDKMVRLRNEIDPKPTDRSVVACVKKGLRGIYSSAVINIEELSELRSTLSKLMKTYEEGDQFRKQTKTTVPTNQKLLNTTTQRPSQPAQQEKLAMRPNVTSKPASEFKLTCYNCDRVGHLSKYCPEPYDQNKVNQHFANVYNARNPRPSNNYQRNNAWPPNRSNQNGRPNHQYNLRGDPTPPVGTSEQSTVASTNIARQNMYKRNRQWRNRQPSYRETTQKAQNSMENLRVCTLPSLEIVIGGRKTEALVDTGGVYSLMSIDMVIALGLDLTPTTLQLKGVGDSDVGVIGRVIGVPVLFDRYVVEMPFVVVHALLPHVILGVDFVEATNLVIHTHSGKVQFFVKLSVKGKSPCSDSEFEESVRKGERPAYRIRHATQAEKKFIKEGQFAHFPRRTSMERQQYSEVSLRRCPPQRRQPRESIATALRSAQPPTRAHDQIDDPWYDEGTWWSTEVDTNARAKAFGPKPTYGSSHGYTQIPAYTEQKVTLSTRHIPPGLKYVRSSPIALELNLLVIPGIVDIRSAFVKVVVRNQTPYDITVTPNSDIAIFEDFDGDLVEINRREPSPADINCFNQRFDNIPGLANQSPTINECRPQVVDSVEEYMKHFNIGEQVEPNQLRQLTDSLVEYRDRFVLEGDQLGQVTIEEHHINTDDHPPVSCAPYRVSAFERKAIEEQVQSMLEQGIIEPIISEWASPL